MRGATEGWPSGLRHRSLKPACLQGHRGFESHPFRQNLLKSLDNFVLQVSCAQSNVQTKNPPTIRWAGSEQRTCSVISSCRSSIGPACAKRSSFDALGGEKSNSTVSPC